MSIDSLFDGSDAHLLPDNPAACADFLRRYNTWRRGDAEDSSETEMPHPREIGLNIDYAITLIEQRGELMAAIDNLLKVKGRHNTEIAYKRLAAVFAKTEGDHLRDLTKMTDTTTAPAIIFYPAGSLGEEVAP